MFYKNFNSILLFLLVFFVVSAIHAQDGILGTNSNNIEELCGVEELPGTVPFGGVYLPAEGTIRALVVFVQFPDDQLTSSNWPLNQMPTYADHYIDNVVTSNPTPKSITDYFHVMSNGRLNVIGDIYPTVVTTQHTRDWYGDHFDNLWGNPSSSNYKNRFGYINREVLVSIDNSVDFSNYDNWTISGSAFSNVPDGEVDMIFMVYRNHARDFPSSEWRERERRLGVYFWGIAVLGGSSTSDINTNDGVTIDMSWFPGSGLMYKNGFLNDDYSGGYYGFMIGLTAHEFGHYLFGAGHPTSRNLGLMGGTNLAVNSAERERMGWLQFTDITEQNISIPDYVTQNIALRIQLNGTSEYFAIENRQQLSIYDNMENRTGIYITHVTGASTNSIGSMDLECADGNHSWYISEFVQNPYNPACDMMAIWRNSGPNPISGIDERECISANDPCTGWSRCFNKLFDKINGQVVLTYENLGDSEDAFNIDYNQVFSPWSDPITYKANGTSSDKALEIISYNSVNHSFNLKFFDGNPEDARPSKPLNLQISEQDDHPYLTWYSNSEPDLRRYRVYRLNADPDWFYVTGTSYIDEDVEVSQHGTNINYHVKAEDLSGLLSTPSNQVSIHGSVGKPIAQRQLYLPKTFTLSQNYPNPFNPTTRISFNIPEETQVKLLVYNINGQIIVSLINDRLETGRYTIQFDASNIPSGFYFYRISAGGFTDVKRMILIK